MNRALNHLIQALLVLATFGCRFELATRPLNISGTGGGISFSTTANPSPTPAMDEDSTELVDEDQFSDQGVAIINLSITNAATPNRILAGTAGQIHLVLRNRGALAWNAHTALHLYPDTPGLHWAGRTVAVNAVSLPTGDIPPGANAEFWIDFTAPSEPGTVKLFGRLQDSSTPKTVIVPNTFFEHSIEIEPTIVMIGSEKQLFIDRYLIHSSQGVSLLAHSAEKAAGPLLSADQPWEAGGLMSFLSVVNDHGKFRMWYEAQTASGRSYDPKLLYAESTDGTVWSKPTSQGFLVAGKPTNIVFQGAGSVVGTCVFLDPTAPPSERYKLITGNGIERGYPLVGGVSADGLHWRYYQTTQTWTRPDGSLYTSPVNARLIFTSNGAPAGSDTQQSCFYDPQTQQYVAFNRIDESATGGFLGVRRAGRTQGNLFSFEQNLVAGLLPIPSPGPSAKPAAYPTPAFALTAPSIHARAFDPAHSGIYNTAAGIYPGVRSVYVAFPSYIDESPGSDNTLVPYVMVSRDSVHFKRIGRKPAITLGAPGQFDSKMIYVAPGMQQTGDQLSLYYAGSPVSHDKVKPTSPRGTAFNRAIFQLDGLRSADSDTAGGELTTVPMIFTGSTFHVNLEVKAGGIMTVALLDAATNQPIPGFSEADADAMVSSGRDQVVTWRGISDLSHLAGQAIRIQARLRSASWFSFRFAEVTQSSVSSGTRVALVNRNQDEVAASRPNSAAPHRAETEGYFPKTVGQFEVCLVRPLTKKGCYVDMPLKNGRHGAHFLDAGDEVRTCKEFIVGSAASDTFEVHCHDDFGPGETSFGLATARYTNDAVLVAKSVKTPRNRRVYLTDLATGVAFASSDGVDGPLSATIPASTRGFNVCVVKKTNDQICTMQVSDGETGPNTSINLTAAFSTNGCFPYTVKSPEKGNGLFTLQCDAPEAKIEQVGVAY